MKIILFCLSTALLLSSTSFADESFIGDGNVGVYVNASNSSISASIHRTEIQNGEINTAKANTGQANDYSNQATWASKSFENGWAYAYSNGNGTSSVGSSEIKYGSSDEKSSSSSKTSTSNTGQWTEFEGGIGGGSFAGGNFGFAIGRYQITSPKTISQGQTLSGSSSVTKIPGGVKIQSQSHYK